MKTVLLQEYNFGKTIADNLESLIANKYTNISDEEYNRIQNAIEEYLSYNSDHKSFGSSISKKEIENLRNEIRNYEPISFDVEEDGLYFVDEEGYIGAKIISTGLYAININSDNANVPQNIVGALSDLSDVDIVIPINGQSLVYNSTTKTWKNTTTEGSISGDFTIVDY